MFKQNNNIFEKDVVSFAEGMYGSSYSIPAFQRAYKWSSQPKKIIDCLDSINRGFNMGSIIIWDSNVKGISREKQNLNTIKDSAHYSYIVDGQQRTLTLVSLFSKDDNIDPANILDKDIHIIYVPKDNKIRFSFQKPKNSITMTLSKFKKKILFGIEKDFNFYKEYSEDIADGKSNLIDLFKIRLLTFRDNLKMRKIIIGYKLQIGKSDINDAIKQFEKINSAGIKLQEFDILDALAFSDNSYKLADPIKWIKNSKFDGLTKAGGKEYSADMIKIILNSYKLIKNFSPSVGIESVSLSAEAISNFENGDTSIFALIFKHLKSFVAEVNSLGLSSLKDVPYTHNVTAYIFLKTIEDLKQGFENQGDKSFIYNLMFLTGIQSSYKASASQKLLKHITKLYDLLSANEPIYISDYDETQLTLSVSDSDIIKSSYKEISAMEKAIFIYWINEIKPLDFDNTDSLVSFSGMFKKSKQLDHIFPSSVYDRHNIGNIALIEKETNISKGAKLPSEFFSGKPYDENFEMYKSHLINEAAYDDLINDDIQSFINKRSNTIATSLSEYIQQLKDA